MIAHFPWYVFLQLHISPARFETEFCEILRCDILPLAIIVIGQIMKYELLQLS